MKKYNQDWVWMFRSPKTTNEIRQYYAHKDLVKIRSKRSPHGIPNAYDDVHVCKQKTWKHKRKTQYRGRAQKTKYTIVLGPRISEWNLTEYFEKHNIPFKLEEIRKSKISYHYKTKRIDGPLVPAYNYAFKPENRHQVGWKPAWHEWVTTDEIEERKYSYTEKYILTYWTDKEVDIDAILNKSSY